jgi:hypothetical protein
VLVNGLPGDPIDDVAGAIQQDGGRSAAFAGDVEVEEHARACVDIARYGRLDILVNNAGVLLVNAETDDMPVDRFDEHVRCNTRSAFLMTRYALPYLRTTRGNVICAGSESGISGRPRNTVYGATKAFLHAFYAFLASDEASFVTGALWLVDGGSTPAKGPSVPWAGSLNAAARAARPAPHARRYAKQGRDEDRLTRSAGVDGRGVTADSRRAASGRSRGGPLRARAPTPPPGRVRRPGGDGR